MKPALGILCFHRIVEDDDELSWPYLERGTGVRRWTLMRQVAEICRFADIIGEEVALSIIAQRIPVVRPAVWMTFDDGYRDILAILDVLETATVFVTTCTRTQMLPADAWYSALLSAGRKRGFIDLGLGAFEFDLSTPGGRARLVHGPERRAFLRAGSVMQSETLARLSRQLGATGMTEPRYLGEAELSLVVRHGWSMGSHGVTHRPFDSIDADAARHEAETSRDILRALGSVRTFALPDGASGHARLLHEAGYDCVLGLGDAPCGYGLDVQPRFIVPDDATWPTRVLEPALTATKHE